MIHIPLHPLFLCRLVIPHLTSNPLGCNLLSQSNIHCIPVSDVACIISATNPDKTGALYFHLFQCSSIHATVKLHFIKILCRLEAERKDLQEKEDAYCRHVLKAAEDCAKYKSYMKVINILYVSVICPSWHRGNIWLWSLVYFHVFLKWL